MMSLVVYVIETSDWCLQLLNRMSGNSKKRSHGFDLEPSISRSKVEAITMRPIFWVEQAGQVTGPLILKGPCATEPLHLLERCVNKQLNDLPVDQQPASIGAICLQKVPLNRVGRLEGPVRYLRSG